ncbi:hypothetical protein ABPG75_005799 [Micractinium tetrahymenae]
MAACSRGNLKLLLATKAELGKLAEVQALAATAAAAGDGGPASPLRRIKYGGKYHLLPASHLVLPASGGKPALAVQAPSTAAAAAGSAQLQVPLASVSGTNLLVDPHWESAGQQELARLQAATQQRGQVLPPAEVRQPPRQAQAGSVALA